MGTRGDDDMPTAPKKPDPTARLRARLEVLTGKGTEEMRASLRAQIDALTVKKPVGGS